MFWLVLQPDSKPNRAEDQKQHKADNCKDNAEEGAKKTYKYLQTKENAILKTHNYTFLQ